VSARPSPLGPIGSRRQAALAARALASATPAELDDLLRDGPLPRLRKRLGDLAESLRYEQAARLRDRIEALEHVVDRLRRLEALRHQELCLLAPASEPGWHRAFFVSGGAVRAVRSLPPGAGARLEIEAGLALCRNAYESDEPLTPEQAEDLLLIDGFVRRPPPELTVLPLEAAQIAAHLARHGLAAAA
jgi:excinuclease UvrABC nuclease subunit